MEKKVVSRATESPTELVESLIESNNWEDPSDETNLSSLEESKTKGSEEILDKPVLTVEKLIPPQPSLSSVGVKSVGFGLYEYESEIELLEGIGSPVGRPIACNMINAYGEESDNPPETSDEDF